MELIKKEMRKRHPRFLLKNKMLAGIKKQPLKRMAVFIFKMQNSTKHFQPA